MAYTGTTLSWQNEAQTNRFCAIAIGTEGETPDVSEVPLGGNLDWTKNASGEEADGFTALADIDQTTGATRPLYLTEDDIKITPVDEKGIEIDPPTSAGLIALIRDKVGIRKVEFTSYEVGAKVMDFATNFIEINATTGVAETDTGVWMETQTHTRVCVCIEILGIGILWLPSCEIRVMPPTGGVKKAATEDVEIDVFQYKDA
jgi:hypothetical protein